MKFIDRNRLRAFLDGRVCSWFVILLAIGSRFIQVLFFFNFRMDRSYQVIGMYQLLHGHGVSVARVSAADLSTIQYDPIVNWPPGYSVLMAPFYLLFNGNANLAAIILDLTAAILLIFSCRGILRIAGLPLWLVNLFTLLNGFFIYEFYFISSTDALSISFFFFGIFQLLRFVKRGGAGLFILSLVGFILAGSIKFMFIPVAFIIAVYLFIKGGINRDRKIKKTAILFFLACLVVFGGMLLYQQVVAGTAVSVVSSGKGFYPSNLLEFYPVLPSAFIREGTVAYFIGNKLMEGHLFQVFQYMNIIACILVLYLIGRKYGNYPRKQNPTGTIFIQISLLVSLVLAALLVWLSVRNAKVNERGNAWTFVEEGRYFGMIILSIQLLFFMFCGARHTVSGKIRWIILPLSLLLSIEFIHGFFFDLKRLTLVSREEYSWQHELRLERSVDTIIQQLKASGKDKKIAIASSVTYIAHRVAIYSHLPVLYETAALNQSDSIKAKTPVLLLFIMEDKDSSKFSGYLHSPQTSLLGRIENFSIYNTSF